MIAPTDPAPVRPTDRVLDVIARDEELVEVFARTSPQLERLRNRALRRVLARLVTVDQAAHMANVPVDRLVRDLNTALGVSVTDAPPSSAVGSATASAPRTHPAGARQHHLDVRADLRAGREPFGRIMRAVAALRPGDVLHLQSPFEPVPLFDVLAKRGFAHEVVEHAPDDWSSWFWRPSPESGVAENAADVAPADVTVVPAPATASGAVEEVWIDVRGMQPPDPLRITLEALEALPRGATLVQMNSRVPLFLLPMLAERGFAFTVDESDPDRVLVRIHHQG